MKNVNFKLHNVSNKADACRPDAFRPVFQYCKIKDGIVWGTDGIVIYKIPSNLIFSECNFEGYIKGEDWKKQQFYKAAKFYQVENQLQAWNSRYKDLGRITIFSEEEVIKDAGKFPDCNVIESGFVNMAVSSISFNVKKLYELIESMGEEFNKITLLFNEETKAIKVDCQNGATGFIMPIKNK